MVELNELENSFKNSVEGLNSIWENTKQYLQNQEKELNSNYEKLKLEYAELSEKYKEATDKVNHIEAQLNETVQRLESMSKSTVKGVNAMQLLDVYLVLMEQVFESGPHVRLLLMLHGDKDEYTLNDLVVASGISAIKVRQAMFELRNANVVDYNDETQIVKLKQRFL